MCLHCKRSSMNTSCSGVEGVSRSFPLSNLMTQGLYRKMFEQLDGFAFRFGFRVCGLDTATMTTGTSPQQQLHRKFPEPSLLRQQPPPLASRIDRHHHLLIIILPLAIISIIILITAPAGAAVVSLPTLAR